MAYTWLFFKKLMFNIQIQQNFILWNTWLHRYQNKSCGKQGLGKAQWITDHCQKGFFWVCGKSRFHEKGKAFHLHSKYQDVSLRKLLKKTKGDGRRPLPPCSQSASTHEQGHLQVKDPLFSWFSSLIKKNLLPLKHQTRSSSIYTKPWT